MKYINNFKTLGVVLMSVLMAVSCTRNEMVDSLEEAANKLHDAREKCANVVSPAVCNVSSELRSLSTKVEAVYTNHEHLVDGALNSVNEVAKKVVTELKAEVTALDPVKLQALDVEMTKAMPDGSGVNNDLIDGPQDRQIRYQDD